eukprot:220513-Hanusia_phi.AAC.3
MEDAVGSAVVLGATGQTGSALVRGLLAGATPMATRVVAYGNSRMPVYDGPNQHLFTGIQARLNFEMLVKRRECGAGCLGGPCWASNE